MKNGKNYTCLNAYNSTFGLDWELVEGLLER